MERKTGLRDSSVGVGGTAEGPQLTLGHRVWHGKGVSAQHVDVDVLMQQRQASYASAQHIELNDRYARPFVSDLEEIRGS